MREIALRDPIAVVAFAPSDVIWAGVRPDGVQTSHWSVDGLPVPSIRFVDWHPSSEPPAYRELYRLSREQADTSTAEIADPEAGHRTVLPGERQVRAGISMARGGTPEADARLGRLAWPRLVRLLGG